MRRKMAVLLGMAAGVSLFSGCARRVEHRPAEVAMAEEQEQLMVTGQVLSTTRDSMILADPAGRRMELRVDDQTQIMMEGEPASLDDIREGSEVRASYVLRDGERVALDVQVNEAALESPGLERRMDEPLEPEREFEPEMNW
jgi:hypothetical protein